MKSCKKKYCNTSYAVRTARNVFVKKFFYDFSTEAKHAIFLSELETPKSLKCPKKYIKTSVRPINYLYVPYLAILNNTLSVIYSDPCKK